MTGLLFDALKWLFLVCFLETPPFSPAPLKVEAMLFVLFKWEVELVNKGFAFLDLGFSVTIGRKW